MQVHCVLERKEKKRPSYVPLDDEAETMVWEMMMRVERKHGFHADTVFRDILTLPPLDFRSHFSGLSLQVRLVPLLPHKSGRRRTLRSIHSLAIEFQVKLYFPRLYMRDRDKAGSLTLRPELEIEKMTSSMTRKGTKSEMMDGRRIPESRMRHEAELLLRDFDECQSMREDIHVAS